MIIIANTDITKYIKQGGISESTQRVYADGSSSEDPSMSKGAHYVYSITAQMPTDIKELMSSYVIKNAVKCSVDGQEFFAEMTNFSASVAIAYGDTVIWNVNFTISDEELSDEEQEG